MRKKTKATISNSAVILYSYVKTLMNPLGNGPVPDALSGIYGAAVKLRNCMYDAFPFMSKATGRPAIGIGGIHAGGTGKTPVALLVGKYAVRKGYEVAFLSRGYRRKTRKNIISKPHTIDTWETVGDEPAMLHAALPESWLGIGANRYTNVKTMSSELSKKSVFILDDAFQHRKIKRDIDIVCLPPGTQVDTLLPSGTLREQIKGLSRAHCICLIGALEESATLEESRLNIATMFPKATVVVLNQVPAGFVNLRTGEFKRTLPLERPIALCGIARPERFIFLLKKMNISISAQSIFNDHHEYDNHEIESIYSNGASGIITTEKDAFRLKSLKLVSCPDIWYLKIDLGFCEPESETLFNRIIDRVLT